jgi:hypothetical protein
VGHAVATNKNEGIYRSSIDGIFNFALGGR